MRVNGHCVCPPNMVPAIVFCFWASHTLCTGRWIHEYPWFSDIGHQVQDGAQKCKVATEPVSALSIWFAHFLCHPGGTLSARLYYMSCVWLAAGNYQEHLLDAQWFKMFHIWCASQTSSFMVFFQSLSFVGKIELAPTAKVWLSTCTAPKAMLGQYNGMNGLGLKHQRSLKQLCFVVKPRIGVLPFHPADVGKLPRYFRNRFIIQMNHL